MLDGEIDKEACRRTMLLHNRQEFHDNFRARPYKDLTLAGFLGVVDGIERIVEDAGLDHLGGVVGLCSGWTRFSTRYAR